MGISKKIKAKAADVSLKAGYLATVGVGGAVSTGYCATSADGTLQNLLKIIFNVMMFGGIISIAYGAVLLFRALTSQDSGDPHGITKGIGWVVGGVVMVSIKAIVTAVMGGQDPTTQTFIGQ